MKARFLPNGVNANNAITEAKEQTDLTGFSRIPGYERTLMKVGEGGILGNDITFYDREDGKTYSFHIRKDYSPELAYALIKANANVVEDGEANLIWDDEYWGASNKYDARAIMDHPGFKDDVRNIDAAVSASRAYGQYVSEVSEEHFLSYNNAQPVIPYDKNSSPKMSGVCEFEYPSFYDTGEVLSEIFDPCDPISATDITKTQTSMESFLSYYNNHPEIAIASEVMEHLTSTMQSYLPYKFINNDLMSRPGLCQRLDHTLVHPIGDTDPRRDILNYSNSVPTRNMQDYMNITAMMNNYMGSLMTVEQAAAIAANYCAQRDVATMRMLTQKSPFEPVGLTMPQPTEDALPFNTPCCTPEPEPEEPATKDDLVKRILGIK